MKAYSLCIFGLFILGACSQVQGRALREEIRPLDVVDSTVKSIKGLITFHQKRITDSIVGIVVNSLENNKDSCSVQKKEQIKQLHGNLRTISDCLDIGELAANITALSNNATNLALEAGADAIAIIEGYIGCYRSQSKFLNCISTTTSTFEQYLTTVISDSGTVMKLSVDLAADFSEDVLTCLQTPTTTLLDIVKIRTAPCLNAPRVVHN